MGKCWWFLGAMLLAAAGARAQEPAPTIAQREVQSVYAPPAPPRENQGINEGGVNFNFDALYMTDYVWRGIDRSESSRPEDSPNIEFDGKLSFNTGRYPHPFIGVFMNIFNSDPLSRFQEIQPYMGFDWNLRPLLFSVGYNSYIFPERDMFNTSEIFAKCTLDDSYFFRTEKPIASPYVFGAYDYDKGKGVYAEFGISHDFAIEDTSIVLTPNASVAYVNSDHIFAKPDGAVSDPAFDYDPTGSGTGFQHYQVGLTLTYGLNQALNIPKRWGDFDVKAYLAYTDGIDNKLRADTEIWGGVGLAFSY
jgi:hypothetical protein